MKERYITKAILRNVELNNTGDISKYRAKKQGRYESER